MPLILRLSDDLSKELHCTVGSLGIDRDTDSEKGIGSVMRSNQAYIDSSLIDATGPADS